MFSHLFLVGVVIAFSGCSIKNTFIYTEHQNSSNCTFKVVDERPIQSHISLPQRENIFISIQPSLKEIIEQKMCNKEGTLYVHELTAIQDSVDNIPFDLIDLKGRIDIDNNMTYFRSFYKATISSPFIDTSIVNTLDPFFKNLFKDIEKAFK